MHPLTTYLCTFGSKICVPFVCTTIRGYKLFVSLFSGIHLICIPAFPFDLPTQSVTYIVTTMNTNTCLQSYICTQKIFIVEQRKLLHIDGHNMLNCTCTIYIVTSRCMNEKSITYLFPYFYYSCQSYFQIFINHNIFLYGILYSILLKFAL